MEIHYWKKIFVEIATRAIRQCHFEYQVISFPQKNIKIEDLHLINSGLGIELVPEETVRDNIVNQLLQMGLWKKTLINGVDRSYWTDREIRFCLAGKEYYVDLSVERYEYDGDIPKEYSPAMIELKRLNTKKIDLKSNPPYSEGQSTNMQIGQIDKDIEKLRSLRKGFKEGKIAGRTVKDDRIVLAILTWGVVTEVEKKELFQKFELPNDFSEVRYFPTEWDLNGNTVLRWCVIVLTEIDNTDFKA